MAIHYSTEIQESQEGGAGLYATHFLMSFLIKIFISNMIILHNMLPWSESYITDEYKDLFLQILLNPKTY
ncbi:MAG: hypothetical protein ACXAD7_14420 [Candidatus Kariarchaeaceae archaeon]|jgi:hypothetical protein